MALTDPAVYRDKSADWYAQFRRHRVAALRSRVTDDVIAEHSADPRGTTRAHSDQLQEVLNFLRMVPVTEKSFAFAIVPHEQYRLGVMAARGAEPRWLGDETYDSEREAVHAAFMQRLGALGLLSTEVS